MKKVQPRRGALILYVVLLAALIFALVKLFNASDGVDLKYSDVVRLFKTEQVESFSIEDDELTMNLRQPFKNETKLTYKLPDFNLFYSDLGDTIA